MTSLPSTSLTSTPDEMREYLRSMIQEHFSEEDFECFLQTFKQSNIPNDEGQKNEEDVK